jgi:V/A-type H+-transporting ATPase subunit I
VVEKMKLLHITGPKYDIDRIMKQYLEKYEIHFENAMTSLSNVGNVRPFVEANIYKESYLQSQGLLEYLDQDENAEYKDIPPETAKQIIQEAFDQTEKIISRQKEIVEENKRIKRLMEQIEPFRNLDFEFQKMLEFRFIKFRMGRIPIDYYHKLEHYIDDTPYTLFYECHSDEHFVYVSW